MHRVPLGKIASGSLGLAFAASLVDNSLMNVPPGHRGLVYNLNGGIQNKVYKEGTHILIPYLEQPRLYDVRTIPMTISTVTGTKDLQKVNLSLRVLSRPRTDALPEIIKEMGPQYMESVLPNIGNEVLKSVVAQYDAELLLKLRDQVSNKITEALMERATDFNIVVDDASITHLNFSSDFSRAIEEKQVAEQNAERAKFVVMKAEQERIAREVRSEGDAEAAQVVREAIKESGRAYIELQRLETAESIASTLAASKGNVTYLPNGDNGSNMLLNLPAASGGRRG